MKLYSNEIVFRGHPDKVADQISDALLDAYICGDKFTRAGIEVVGGKGKIFITGEVTSKTEVDVEFVAKRVLADVGYNPDNYEIINNIGKQSPDIALGVDMSIEGKDGALSEEEAIGAGDQGMTFGYACDETYLYVPKAMAILQEFSRTYEAMRKKNPDLFYADGKAQITGYYDDEFRLIKIKTFTISYQNSETDREFTDHLIKTAAEMICYKNKVEVEEFLINPTGKFLIGGFDGDAGLTNRKIVVDTYQSFAHIGGGGLSGKDATKVDRSGHYKARQLAIRTLKKYNLKWCEIQLSYAIGKAEPLAIYIDSDKGNLEVPAEWYKECTPANMIKDLKLRQPIYEETACFGHFGCPPDAFGRRFSWEY